MSDVMEASFCKEGAAAYREAMDAARRFAKLTKCPLGISVIGWLESQTYELEMAVREAINPLPTKQG